MTDACTNAPTHSRKPCCKRLSGQKGTGQTSTHCINVWSNYGRSVIIGFQKTQIYQRFAGSRQEVFILKIQNDENNAAQQDNGRRFHIILPRPRPMSHGLAMMTRTASGSMNGGITAATVPPWNRTLRRGCRSTSTFTMSVSSRPRLPASTSITLPSAQWTLGHSPSRPTTPWMKLSTTISASRLKTELFWRGGI